MSHGIRLMGHGKILPQLFERIRACMHTFMGVCERMHTFMGTFINTDVHTHLWAHSSIQTWHTPWLIATPKSLGVHRKESCHKRQGITSLIWGSWSRHQLWYSQALQHTATRCNMPQHTATQCVPSRHGQERRCGSAINTGEFGHCNTLQHTAPRCNALQHSAYHPDMSLRVKDFVAPSKVVYSATATRCNTLLHTATCCNILHHSAYHPDMSKRDDLVAPSAVVYSATIPLAFLPQMILWPLYTHTHTHPHPPTHTYLELTHKY